MFEYKRGSGWVEPNDPLTGKDKILTFRPVQTSNPCRREPSVRILQSARLSSDRAASVIVIVFMRVFISHTMFQVIHSRRFQAHTESEFV
jgi:hypothetical protein